MYCYFQAENIYWSIKIRSYRSRSNFQTRIFISRLFCLWALQEKVEMMIISVSSLKLFEGNFFAKRVKSENSSNCCPQLSGPLFNSEAEVKAWTPATSSLKLKTKLVLNFFNKLFLNITYISEVKIPYKSHSHKGLNLFRKGTVTVRDTKQW